jgi:methyl-accepting chemotaxis protein
MSSALTCVKRFQQLKTTYETLLLIDANGKIYASESTSPEGIKGLDIAGDPSFQEVKISKQTVSGEMVRSKATNEPVIFLCGPILSENGAFLGAFGAFLKGSVLMDLITAKKIGTTGYCFMANKEGIITAHPDGKHVLQLDLKTLKGMEEITREMMAGKIGAEGYVFKEIDKVAGYAPVKLKGWSVAATQDSSEFLASVVSLRNTIA